MNFPALSRARRGKWCFWCTFLCPPQRRKVLPLTLSPSVPQESRASSSLSHGVKRRRRRRRLCSIHPIRGRWTKKGGGKEENFVSLFYQASCINRRHESLSPCVFLSSLAKSARVIAAVTAPSYYQHACAPPFPFRLGTKSRSPLSSLPLPLSRGQSLFAQTKEGGLKGKRGGGIEAFSVSAEGRDIIGVWCPCYFCRSVLPPLPPFPPSSYLCDGRCLFSSPHPLPSPSLNTPMIRLLFCSDLSKRIREREKRSRGSLDQCVFKVTGKEGSGRQTMVGEASKSH